MHGLSHPFVILSPINIPPCPVLSNLSGQCSDRSSRATKREVGQANALTAYNCRKRVEQGKFSSHKKGNYNSHQRDITICLSYRNTALYPNRTLSLKNKIIYRENKLARFQNSLDSKSTKIFSLSHHYSGKHVLFNPSARKDGRTRQGGT